MTHPKAISVFKELTSHPNVTLCESIVPYSFLVIDGSVVGLEIVNPEDPYSFFFGLKFRNEGLAVKLRSHFESLISNSEKDSLATIIETQLAELENESRTSSQLLTN